MLYSCTRMATVGIKELKKVVQDFIMARVVTLFWADVNPFTRPLVYDRVVVLCEQTPGDSTASKQRPQTPPGVVDAYRAKVNAERQQQREQQQDQARSHLTVENDNSYRRADSDYSIDNISQLFNVGDEATPR